MADPTDTDTTDVATDPATDPTTGQPKPAGPTITGSDFGQTIVKRTNPDGSVTTITTENTGNRILETQRTDPTTGAVIKSTVNEVDGSQENSTTWPDGRVVTNHSDHAGRTTTEEVAKGSDGSEWRQVRTADGATSVTRTLLDPDGTTRVVTRDPDGKIEVTSTKEVKLEGGKAQTTRVEPDGSTMTITKDTIDDTTDVILRHPDGTWERTVTSQDPNDPSTKVERTTSSQGKVMETRTTDYGDGSKTIIASDPNDKTATPNITEEKTYTDANGAKVEESHVFGESTTRTITRPDGSIDTTTSYEDGRPNDTHSLTKYPDGTTVDQTSKGGQNMSIQQTPDGFGGYVTTTTDFEGNVHEVRQNSDGSSLTTHDLKDGGRQVVERDPDGGGKTMTWVPPNKPGENDPETTIDMPPEDVGTGAPPTAPTPPEQWPSATDLNNDAISAATPTPATGDDQTAVAAAAADQSGDEATALPAAGGEEGQPGDMAMAMQGEADAMPAGQMDQGIASAESLDPALAAQADDGTLVGTTASDPMALTDLSDVSTVPATDDLGGTSLGTDEGALGQDLSTDLGGEPDPMAAEQPDPMLADDSTSAEPAPADAEGDAAPSEDSFDEPVPDDVEA